MRRFSKAATHLTLSVKRVGKLQWYPRCRFFFAPSAHKYWYRSYRQALPLRGSAPVHQLHQAAIAKYDKPRKLAADMINSKIFRTTNVKTPGYQVRSAASLLSYAFPATPAVCQGAIVLVSSVSRGPCGTPPAQRGYGGLGLNGATRSPRGGGILPSTFNLGARRKRASGQDQAHTAGPKKRIPQD